MNDYAMDVIPEQDEYTDFTIYDTSGVRVRDIRVVMSSDPTDYEYQVSSMRFDLEMDYMGFDIVETKGNRND
jgi:hypothetical protein